MKKREELISIILPCYKSENFISDIIDDVFNQDYNNWELIIVSNGNGQEKQLKIIHEKCSDKENIRVLTSDIGSVSNARNMGIEDANGEWITFIDADDHISSKYLSSLYSKADDDVDIVFGGITRYSIIDRTSKNYTIKDLHGIDSAFVSLDELLTRSPCSKLIRKSIVKESDLLFDIKLTYAEDALFMFTLYELTQKFASVELSGYKYMIYSSGSACTKYHDQSTYEGIHNELLDIEKRLRKKVLSEEETINWYYNKRFLYLYLCFINLFREDTPLKIKEKTTHTKKLIFNNSYRHVLSEIDKKRRGLQVDTFIFFSKYTNPRIMTFAFETLTKMKYKFGGLYKFFKRNR